MEILIQRKKRLKTSTPGEMEINGKFFAYTLEDPIRPKPEKKVWGNTAIAAGRYKVVVTYSPKFDRLLPELLEVPNFEAIRIHGGNTVGDTHGCPLIGRKTNNADRVWDCFQLDQQLTEIILGTFAEGNECFITINDPEWGRL
jgi:hypothetical protein